MILQGKTIRNNVWIIRVSEQEKNAGDKLSMKNALECPRRKDMRLQNEGPGEYPAILIEI